MVPVVAAAFLVVVVVDADGVWRFEPAFPRDAPSRPSFSHALSFRRASFFVVSAGGLPRGVRMGRIGRGGVVPAFLLGMPMSHASRFATYGRIRDPSNERRYPAG